MGFDGKSLATLSDTYCFENQITKKQFSRDTGISSATLSQWRTGQYTPSQKNIRQLEEYFGVSIDEFMAGNYKEKSPSRWTSLNIST